MRRFLSLCFVVLVVSSAHGQRKDLPYVLLISLDGFSNQYIHKYELPNLKKFIKEGAEAEGLIPSFPSKTFPNHYTLVTGMYPGHHGLVDNHFYDPATKSHYTMKNPEAVKNKAFYGGEPLWKLASSNGVKSASYFWVGSELKEESERPDYTYEYNESIPFGDRISQVIDWLNLPESERPHFISLYFSSPDHESHEFGPFSKEAKDKVIEMDSLVGVLMQKIESTKLPVNVLLVSDHGMSELFENESTYVFLDEIVSSVKNKLTVVNGGTQAHIYTTSEKQLDSLYTVLQQQKKFNVIKRKDFPKRWNYNNSRSGDILIMANPGTYLISGKREKFLANITPGATFGAHGYDPEVVKDMRGIFYAKGPNIKPGTKIQAFQNIHVYPLVAAILGLKPKGIDGNFKVLKPVFRK